MQKLIRCLLIVAVLAFPCAAQQCVLSFNLSTAASSTPFNNLTRGCVDWTVTYNTTGFTGLTFTVETAPNVAGVPGSWSTFTAATGSNPETATTQASATFTGYFPFVRVTLSGLTGTGTVTGLLYGTWTSNGGGGVGGGCASPCPVEGVDAAGSPATVPPVYIGGSDGTNVQPLKLSTAGRVELATETGTSQADSAPNTPAAVLGGATNTVFRTYNFFYDPGSNTWYRARGNSTAGQFVQGAAAAGATSTMNPFMIGGITEGGTTAATVSTVTNTGDTALHTAPGRDSSNIIRPLSVNSSGGLQVGASNSALADNASGNTAVPTSSAGAAVGIFVRQQYYDEVSDNYDRMRGSSAAGLAVGGFGSGATGTLYGMTACDSSAVITVSAAATTELVPLTASRSVRVCSFSITADTVASTAQFVQGTGTNCGTGTANLTGAMAMGVASNMAAGSGLGELFKTTAGNALCLAAVAGTVSGVVSYAKF